MSRFSELFHPTTTITIPRIPGPGTQTVPCRAERAERVAGGAYYQDWVVTVEQRVAYGASCTVAGEVARTAYDVRELQDPLGAVVGYKVILGHV